jgi:hypothetical protein
MSRLVLDTTKDKISVGPTREAVLAITMDAMPVLPVPASVEGWLHMRRRRCIIVVVIYQSRKLMRLRIHHPAVGMTVEPWILMLGAMQLR